MDKQLYTLVARHTLGDLSESVQLCLADGDTLIGGPFSHAGMVCQAIMMTIHEEETEHERDDSSDNNNGN